MNDTALKERLRVIGKEKGITFNEAWKQLLLERFLSRLSRSENHDKFIFKGGLLLSQYISIGRETTDADFFMNYPGYRITLATKLGKMKESPHSSTAN